MLTPQQHHGNAIFIAGALPVTLTPYGPRVITVLPKGDSEFLVVPDAKTVVNLGGPIFDIINVGLKSIFVKEASGPTVTEVGANQVARLSCGILNGLNHWFPIISKLGIARPAFHSPRPDPADIVADVAPTFMPACGVYCDSLSATVAHPWPMYFNSTLAKNATRDAIRAADYTAFTKFQIQITAGMIKDPASSYPTALSPEMQHVLYATHELVYEATTMRATSRHPHHVRWSDGGGAWIGPTTDGVPVYRKMWRKQITYTVGGADKHLDIRIVAEYSTDLTKGAWGTLWNFYVFSDEVGGGFADGDTVPALNDAPFWADDPLIYLPDYAGANTAIKAADPRLLMAASTVTSFQSPAEYAHIPGGEELWVECYRRHNGAPWTATPGVDCEANSVFATYPDGSSFACMSIGGNAPTSEIYPFICIENGAGTGLTVMKPTHAGWNESVGLLQPPSDIILTDCTAPQTAIDACQGHPDAPYNGRGGTHNCFKTGSGAKYCCFNLADGLNSATFKLIQKCMKHTTHLGAFNGETCDAGGTSCSEQSNYLTTLTLRLENYDFGGLSSSAVIKWWAGAADPTYVTLDYIFDNTSPTISQFVAVQGTWSTGTNVNGDHIDLTVSGGSAPGGFLLFDNGVTIAHGRISATLEFINNRSIGVGLCADSFGNGYFAVAVPTTQKLEIRRYAAFVPTVLASVDVATPMVFDLLAEISLTKTGTRLAAVLLGVAVGVDECFDDLKFHGCSAVLAESNIGNCRFYNPVFRDQNASYPNPGAITGIQLSQFAEVDEQGADPTKPRIYMSVDAMGMYQFSRFPSCVDLPTPPCGPPDCNCDEISYVPYFVDPFVITSDLAYVNVLGGGNPSSGPFIPCPDPYLFAQLNLPGACGSQPGGTAWDKCPGAEWWFYQTPA